MTLYPGTVYGWSSWISFGLYCELKHDMVIIVEWIYFVDNDMFDSNYTYEADEPTVYVL